MKLFRIDSSIKRKDLNEISTRRNRIYQDRHFRFAGLLDHFTGSIEEFGFKGSDRLLFHIDEAMSWESVRDLKIMKPLILVIENIANQSAASEELRDLVKNVRVNY